MVISQVCDAHEWPIAELRAVSIHDRGTSEGKGFWEL